MAAKNPLEAKPSQPITLGSKWLLHFGRWYPWLPSSSNQQEIISHFQIAYSHCVYCSLLPLAGVERAREGGVSASAHNHSLMLLSGKCIESCWAKSLWSGLAWMYSEESWVRNQMFRVFLTPCVSKCLKQECYGMGDRHIPRGKSRVHLFSFGWWPGLQQSAASSLSSFLIVLLLTRPNLFHSIVSLDGKATLL